MLKISHMESEEQISAIRELLHDNADWIFTLAVGYEGAPTFEV